MGAGYTRQSAAAIVTGADITAAPLNAEFNALQSAFNSSTGHTHDGTSGEGPLIDLTTSITGILPVASGGIAAKHKIDATAAPGTSDDSSSGYGPGSLWIDVTNDKAYVCVDATVASAVWFQISTSSYISAIGALTPTDSNIIVGNGTTWVAESGATARTSLGIGTGDTPQFTGIELGHATDTTISRASAGRIAVEGSNVLMASDLGSSVQAYDAELAALAGLTSAADKVPYFTGSAAASLADFTAYGRSLVAVANEAAFKSLVNLEAGVDYQAYDAELAAIAGLTSAANKVPYFTGAGTAGLLDFKDEDNMASNSATAVPSQQSVKAYVDSQVGGVGFSINDLSDVTITAAATGDFLRYNGSAWVDFPETSISITESQISDLGTTVVLTSDIGSSVQGYDADLSALAGVTDSSHLTDIGNLTLASGDILYANSTPALAKLAKGTDGQVLTLASGLPAWDDLPASTPTLTAGTKPWSVPSSNTSTSSTSYAKALSIYVPGTGAVRAYFDLKVSGSGTAYGRIYVNGVAVGVEKSTTSAGYSTQSSDISVSLGDTVELWLKKGGGASSSDATHFYIAAAENPPFGVAF